MEKFIKQYGIWIVGAIAIYWFFIREKEDELATDESEWIKGGPGGVKDYSRSSGYRGDDMSNWKLFGKRMKRIRRAKF
jgi:hypothetical protein